MTEARTVPVPVLLVTGALGAGKTTLINALLRADHGLALAVVVNDFGAINIDEMLLSATGQPVYGLKNGCICCSLQGDLLRTLAAILSVPGRRDAIVIEASGVSDPRGILDALFDPVLRDAVRVDAVVTLVDAEAFDPADALWRAQVAAADFVLLTKTARLAPAALAGLRETLGALQKALVFDADGPQGLPLDLLLTQRFDHPAAPDARVPVLPDERFVRLEWSAPGPVALARFQAAIARLAPQLARAKGFVEVADRPGARYLFQLVGRRASLAPAEAAEAEAAGTQLVFIGRKELFDVDAARCVLDALRPA